MDLEATIKLVKKVNISRCNATVAGIGTVEAILLLWDTVPRTSTLSHLLDEGYPYLNI